jgi:hypothetical protein
VNLVKLMSMKTLKCNVNGCDECPIKKYAENILIKNNIKYSNEIPAPQYKALQIIHKNQDFIPEESSCQSIFNHIKQEYRNKINIWKSL